MNIGLDMYPFVRYMNRGIGNYTKSLYQTLFLLDKDNSYFLLNWGNDVILPFFSVSENVVEVTVNKDIDISNINAEENMKRVIEEFLKNYNLDIFYTPNALTLFAPCYQKSWFNQVKLTGTVHDITWWVMQGKYLLTEGERVHARQYCLNLHQFDMLYSNSETTKEDLKKYFDIGNISNISMSIEKKDYSIEIINNRWDKIKEEKKIQDSYWLFVGGICANKNLLRVVRAYLHYMRKTKEAKQLVIVCQLNEVALKEVNDFIRRYNLRGKLIFTNFVSDEELVALYKHAEWLVFPTLYEGFGMPVLEAWYYGIPVMASNNSSLKEIAGGASVQVDPYSVESIENGFFEIEQMDEKEREHYIELGKNRTEDFSWKKTAMKLLECWNKLKT